MFPIVTSGKINFTNGTLNPFLSVFLPPFRVSFRPIFCKLPFDFGMFFGVVSAVFQAGFALFVVFSHLSPFTSGAVFNFRFFHLTNIRCLVLKH